MGWGDFLKGLVGAIPVIGDIAGPIVGGLIQSGAEEHGQDLQAKYAEEALAYQKEQDKYKRQTEANRYGMVMAGLSPYASEGAHANAAMGSFLGLPTPDTSSTKSPMSSSLVMMRAPDGSTKQVPASEMQHWIDKGATLSGTGDDQTSSPPSKPNQMSPQDVLARLQAPRPMPPMR